MSSSHKRVYLLGATGTIGRAVLRALEARGDRVTSHTRGQRFNMNGHTVVISCMASRTGHPVDAWAVDHRAHLEALNAAKVSGVNQFILLSAICVQKPLLAFQDAKLAFENELQASGLTWTIIRPTAYFKSLSGQMKRVLHGKPYLLFGDGQLTSCLPISNGDLAHFIVSAIDDRQMHNRILPIGGPGKALTPRDVGAMMFAAAGKPPRYRHVPIAFMDGMIGTLSVMGKLIPSLAAKAELARIGRYYATESMLVWEPVQQRYDMKATPQFGRDMFEDHIAKLAKGDVSADLGDHAVF